MCRITTPVAKPLNLAQFPCEDIPLKTAQPGPHAAERVVSKMDSKRGERKAGNRQGSSRSARKRACALETRARGEASGTPAGELPRAPGDGLRA